MLSAVQQEELRLLQVQQDRKLVRSNLIEWATFCVREQGLAPTGPAKHHKFLLDLLQKLIDGALVHPDTGKVCRNLIVLMPPGSAKSTYTSICTPPWYLQRKPGNRILACSAGKDLIQSFSYQCRGIVQAHAETLGFDLASDSTAVEEWRTNNNGTYRCGSVGSNITGRRADFGYIDDYLGKEADAVSDLVLEGIHTWYWRDFWPRLKPDAIQAIIANRRAVTDLVGWLLKEEPHKWMVIRLPMLAEENDPLGRLPGERLWPDYFTDEMVQTAMAQSDWAGLYQQRPALAEGDYFKADWLVGYEPQQLPRDLRYYIASDHAYRTNQKNDRTAIVVCGVDHRNQIWVLPSWFWKRVDSGAAVDEMLEKNKVWHPQTWWLGKDAFEGVVAPFIRVRMRETNNFINLEPLTESKDKEVRARSIQARMRQKVVFFPKFAPGWKDVESELLNFPNDEHDDWVDALANLGRGLDRMIPAELTVTPTENFGSPRLTMGFIKQQCAWKERQRRLARLDY
jgi:predicted phage terminase large subunit-like protein